MSKVALPPNKNSRQKVLAHAFLVLGLAMFGITAFVIFRPRPETNSSAAANEFILPTPASYPAVQGNAIGDPNAPVVIEEFSDFQCPYCRQFALATKPAIVEDYVATGKVYFVYRTLGDWLGPESQLAAEAAYCAGDQNRFWDYHDALFFNQGQVNFSADNLLALANALDLDMNEFRACVTNYKYRDQVQKDLKDGLGAGVRGTPSFLINGRFIAGIQPYQVFQREIETALARVGESQGDTFSGSE